MNRTFSISPPFRVPDGTWVSPFLNAKDSESDLAFDLLDGFSLAAGMIEPHSSSSIHIMPFVTQVTFVRSGRLTVTMKGPQNTKPYQLNLEPEQAVLTEPETYFQLINEGQEPCKVLYIVSPAYTFELFDGHVIYDDSVVIDEDWHELEQAGWKPSRLLPTQAERNATLQRLAAQKK
jgi:mannose-6-phosphate isomerase-like protein (cupin superfamily)